MKNKIWLFFIIVAFLLITFGICMLLFCTNDDKDKKINDNIDESEAIEYLKTIPVTYDNENNIFGNKKIIIDDVSQKILLGNIYSNLEINEVSGSGKNDFDESNCNSSDGIYAFNKCYFEGDVSTKNYYFKRDFLIDKFNKVYGRNVETLSDESFTNDDFCRCDIKNEYYFCRCNDSFANIGYSKNLIMLDSYEKNGDDIVINIKYLFAKYESGDESGNMYVNIYDRDGGSMIGYTHSFSNEIIFGTYKDKASIYKSIFKKNIDGSYYWYSIEPVKNN